MKRTETASAAVASSTVAMTKPTVVMVVVRLEQQHAAEGTVAGVGEMTPASYTHTHTTETESGQKRGVLRRLALCRPAYYDLLLQQRRQIGVLPSTAAPVFSISHTHGSQVLTPRAASYRHSPYLSRTARWPTHPSTSARRSAPPLLDLVQTQSLSQSVSRR